ALVTLTLAACSDEGRVPTSPKAPARPSQLGTPIGQPIGGPINPPGGINPNLLVSITAGDNFTCVRRNDLTIWCWGRDDEGQLGFASSKKCASGFVCADRPTIVPKMSAGYVDAGANHACTLNSLGVSFCWGSSDQGQLGAGVTGFVTNPVVVNNPSTGQPFTFTSISAGQHSTCGTTGSQIFCWGQIQSGATLPTLAVNLAGYTNVAVAFRHACAIFAFYIYSEADCWGMNNVGQAGETPAVWPTVPPTGNSGFGYAVSRVATQGDYTCADLQNGVVQCIGTNQWGTLGNGQSGPTTSTFM